MNDLHFVTTAFFADASDVAPFRLSSSNHRFDKDVQSALLGSFALLYLPNCKAGRFYEYHFLINSKHNCRSPLSVLVIRLIIGIVACDEIVPSLVCGPCSVSWMKLYLIDRTSHCASLSTCLQRFFFSIYSRRLCRCKKSLSFIFK